MSKRYQIWDKTSNVITPIGEVLTPAQWIERYPMANVDGLYLVISGGTINGGFCAEYSSFVDMYTKQGCDFTDCVDMQDFLDVIEAFEDAMNNPEVDENYISTDERIASALEAQLLLQMASDESLAEDEEYIEDELTGEETV